MTTLSNAPLIEAIFEVRWGKLSNLEREIVLEFSREEEDFLAGQFRDSLQNKGFNFVEPILGVGLNLPHEPRNRFRKDKNQWPCYQLGLGILTVNQTNDGYDWESFQENILLGISVLNDVYPGGLDNLNILGTELRYRDGFILSESENVSSFLSSKFNLSLTLPEDILNNLKYVPNQEKYRLAYSTKITDPKGDLTVAINDALINGKKGLILDTIFRSTEKEKIECNFDSLQTWLNAAHDIHRVVFQYMINPAYAESFK